MPSRAPAPRSFDLTLTNHTEALLINENRELKLYIVRIEKENRDLHSRQHWLEGRVYELEQSLFLARKRG